LPHIIRIENIEFIFAIRGPQFPKRHKQHKIYTTQNRRLLSQNKLAKHKIHLAMPNSWDGFSILWIDVLNP